MNTPVFVYVIVSGEAVKIGFARDPGKRVKEIRTGAAEGASIFYQRKFTTERQARFVEKYAHRQLGLFRMSGEWFRCSPHKARSIVSRAKVPPKAELEKNGGYGWREPSNQEVRDAVQSVFSGDLISIGGGKG